MAVTTGIGYDAHRLAAGRPFILGGVDIPWDRGPDGHSDAAGTDAQPAPREPQY